MWEALLIFAGVLFSLFVVTGIITFAIEKGSDIQLQLYKPCCPPGLGCNDPDPERRHCHRKLVFRLAEYDDGEAVDHAWSEFNGVPFLRPIKRKHAKQRYARQRDTILEREIAQMAHKLIEAQPERKELPARSEVINTLAEGKDIANPEVEILDPEPKPHPAQSYHFPQPTQHQIHGKRPR